MRRGGEHGITLLEVLIAVTLLGLLSVGMLTAMRVGLSALGKSDTKLMENRRVSGAQRIIEQEIEGLVPVMAGCTAGPGAPVLRAPFFQGEPEAMRFVSTFSLQRGWRGRPHILEMKVIPGEEGRGVRLIVNEVPYSPSTAGALCLGPSPQPLPSGPYLRFLPIAAGPGSFVLADRLAFCRFVYLEPSTPPEQPRETWRPYWRLPRWPLAIRVEMAPLEPDASRLQPVTITAPLHISRAPDIQYVDF
jgi:general secretion pathway protein J